MSASSDTTFPAFVVEAGEGGYRRGVREMTLDELPSDGALIEVEYSSVNYKDALASTPDGRVARISPLVPGIDLAGRVISCPQRIFSEGELVLAHCYEIGVSRHGGFARYARVPAEWMVPLPEGLSTREAMVIGTAGYTAALSVLALEAHGLRRGEGPVVVTGASGGVGSCAVGLLAARGYEVVASSGKPQAREWLSRLGASEVVGRFERPTSTPRPLESQRWAGAVDCVGGETLSAVVRQLRSGSAVAASGLTGGADLNLTVHPFILRGVSLLGIDAVGTPIEERREIWRRLGDDLRPMLLDEIGTDITLEELEGSLDRVLRADVSGRLVLSMG